MKICVIPSKADKNQYINLINNAIRLTGNTISEKNSFLNIMCADIVHFNWFENLAENSTWRQNVDYFKKLFILKLLKVTGKKIVWTMHNKVPHQLEGRDNSVKLMRWFACHADAIIIHCRQSRSVLGTINAKTSKKKIHYIPHPNYIGAYSGKKIYQGFLRAEHQLVVLFLGQIKQYKNIETVIALANKYKDRNDIKFLFCGNCFSSEYQDKLKSMIKSKNVILDIRFIADDEIPSLMSLADIVVLPYNTTSSLNSGVAILAFSNKKTVLSTDIGTVNDLRDTGCMYIYNYANDREKQIENISICFQKLLFDWERNPYILKEKGIRLYGIMKSDYNQGIIAQSITTMYAEL